MSRKQKRNLIRIIISLFLFALVFTIDKVFGLDTFVGNDNLSWIFPFILYLSIYLLIGYDVLIKALKNLIHGKMLDENFLMCIATLGAFLLLEFDEAVAVLLFYQVGEFFQSYAVGKSRKSIKDLMDIRPTYANIKTEEGKVLTVDPTLVKIGDTILVKPGEKIPLDGIIIKGNSSIDTKSLTGESLPVEVKTGSFVIGGTVNLTSTIEITVEKEFEDSTVSKILELVSNASSQKSRSENFITKFARWYTPIIVLLALILAVIPGIITKEWATWLYRSLSFLVVSCPCALVISIPLSFFAGIGGASRNGILVKGSVYLEELNKANIFVFDKTGTLTKGNFEVTKVEPIKQKETILYYAAIAEKGSNHPIALSIKKAYGKEVKENYSITDVAGMGVIAKDKDIILCGNEKLMLENKISYKHIDELGTVIYVARNNEYIGSIVISDEVKKEAKDMISYLDEIGARSIMLTGDNDEVASLVAKSLGIKEYKASLLPTDKVEEVDKLIKNKKENDSLCFIGDGINDAPVLMRSDIGIAMGGIGSDAAIEASDIVLMLDDLKSIKIAKKIAEKTLRIVKENIIFAISVKILILILSAFGIANMWMAIFGDVGVAIMAILNATRASKND